MATAFAAAATRSPFGRSIGDFGDLNEAESFVIEKACVGAHADLSELAHVSDDVVNTVRGGLVRFLALGGDEQTPVHERGVRIEYGVISGPLDFEGCTVPVDLVLWHCRILETITLRSAKMQTLNLEDCVCQDIVADRVEIAGSLLLRKTQIEGPVTLPNSLIRGSLDCRGATFKLKDEKDKKGDEDNKDNRSLICDRSEIGGGVALGKYEWVANKKKFERNFRAEGVVSFEQAIIRSGFDCGGGHFVGLNGAGQSLVCNRARISGDLRLRGGFRAAGVVSLIGAEIAGDCTCVGGSFEAESPKTALELRRASVTGTLWLAAARQERDITSFRTGVDLSDARLNRIVDATTGMTRRRTSSELEPGPAYLVLDGLSYERFQDTDTDLSVEARLAFLGLQPARGHKAFNPQPWVQMIKVLREMGYEEAARGIAIERQRASRRAGAFTRSRSFFHALYGLCYGYGYRPLLLGAWAIGVALLSTVIFSLAATNGLMGPTDARILDSSRYAACGAGAPWSWTDCRDLPFRYTAFSSVLYSLELAVPIIGARQTKDWAPVVVVPCLERGWFGICREVATVQNRMDLTEQSPGYSLSGILVTAWAYIANLLGWLAGLMFVAVASGLIKKD